MQSSGLLKAALSYARKIIVLTTDRVQEEVRRMIRELRILDSDVLSKFLTELFNFRQIICMHSNREYLDFFKYQIFLIL